MNNNLMDTSLVVSFYKKNEDLFKNEELFRWNR